ncbi:hypothetical protein Sjap_006770 [Stephania japonica]|uniref:Uncharacterized protein n=1 Tax=Stephania japonica TaxID=461633 RepID=A0AAP0K8V5_9MAGN
MPSTPKQLGGPPLALRDNPSVHRSIGNRVGVYDPSTLELRLPLSPGSTLLLKRGHLERGLGVGEEQGDGSGEGEGGEEARRRRRLVERMLGLGLGLELEEWGFGDGGMREGVVGVLTSQRFGFELIPTSVSLVSKL